MTIRVADYIADYLLQQGVHKVFMLNGGMMMHLVDTLGRPGGLEYMAQHHEQASAMAADGYARRSGHLGVCYATSGPGATNLVTGIAGAWQDSTPILFLTGQSKSTQTIQHSSIDDLRQFGTFEVDIVPIVRSLTKYAVMVQDPKTIRYHLEKALFLATSGRPGPVLLDLPLDIQGAQIEPDELESFVPEKEVAATVTPDQMAELLLLLGRAKRPLILAGHGVRCAGAVGTFRRLVDRLDIPVVTTQLGKDILPYEHSCFVGHPGPKGDRPGNFAIQTADLILSIGSSLHAQTTGWELELFAPSAVKVQVELDAAILAREQVGVNLKIQAGAREFIDALYMQPLQLKVNKEWRKCCASWKERFSVANEPHEKAERAINFYEFVEVLSQHLGEGACVVTDAGSAFYVMGQALRLKQGQRFISSGSLGAMGFALPAANGAAATGLPGTTVCVTGDGSLMTNLHELATMKEYNLDLKLFVVNNDGYVSMRNTQREFCAGHYVGADSDSGVFIPSIRALTESFELPYVCCETSDDLHEQVRKTLAIDGPVVCEIVAMRNQKIIPTVVSVKLPDGRMRSSPLHNMFPHLSEEALQQELARATAEGVALCGKRGIL
ncbi:thiamine pyrophosphate-binding protein [Chromobacterium haemolyticum]|uniref:thiamine pyrophosphate-binding protein n=1 Tax=Chromobacterium haemolyticum TaxID=394935 RepID=UPI0006934A38|nr:thiamine pyrophosphate-binding protein [Chromobacterium haemolyticum]